MASPHASSRLQMMQARFQQKQLQEKEQKLLQLYDQQQQRAHQVAQRGSAGSNTSNQGSTMNHQTITKTTSSTRTTTSSSHGGKVRQMFDERRHTTVKGIDRSYPLEPLDNKPKKQISSNGFAPARSKNISRHTVTTVKRTARADVNSNLNGGKPVVSYHEEVNRESYGGNNPDDNEFANENDVGRYLNGNCQHRIESDDEETSERNRIFSNIHSIDLEKSFKSRVVNDLESEQFPEDLMIDVPDKVPRKPIAKKLSQAELRLERFKNANTNSKKNIVTRTTNSSVTRKRSDPLFPTQTTTRKSRPTETRKRAQETSTKSTSEKKRRFPSSSPTQDKKILVSRKNLQTSETIESPTFERREEKSSEVSAESEIYCNLQNPSELKSTFLIREIILGGRPKDLKMDGKEYTLEIKKEEQGETFKIEEKENEAQNQMKKSISGRESPRKVSNSGISRKFSIERTPSPALKKIKTEKNQNEESRERNTEKSEDEIFVENCILNRERTLGKEEMEEKRRGSIKRREPEKRKESMKIREEKRRESKTKEPEKRRESIKSTEKAEENIFISDYCVPKTERVVEKEEIREEKRKDSIKRKEPIKIEAEKRRESIKSTEKSVENIFISDYCVLKREQVVEKEEIQEEKRKDSIKRKEPIKTEAEKRRESVKIKESERRKSKTKEQERRESIKVNAEEKEETKKVEKTEEKRRESIKRREPEKRKESIKTREEKRKESRTKEPEKRRESIKNAEKPEDEIFIDDNCFRKRERKKIKDSIREKLSIDLRNAIQNRFILPVKKPVKKKSQDESRNLEKEILESKDFDKKDSRVSSEESSPEKVFERPSDYQEIVIEDQTIDSRRKSLSPQPRIKSRRESVENSETISSAAKRKPSLEVRRLSGAERIIEKEKKIEIEEKKEENKIEGRKSIELDKPLRSIELVKQADKRSHFVEENDDNFEETNHKIVKKQAAIFEISETRDQIEEDRMKEVETRMKEVEAKRMEVENRMKEVEIKKREVETKMKEMEEKQKEFESKKLNVENKKKVVENKMKEIQTKIKGIGLREEKSKISSLQFDLVKKSGRKSTEKGPEIFGRNKSIEKSEDEVDNVKESYKDVKEVEICTKSKKIDRKNSEEKLKSRTSPIPKLRRISSKSESVKSPQEKVTFEYKSQSEVDIENIPEFGRTDSVESALRRFDSIGTDPDFDTSKASCESIRKSPDSTKSKNEKSLIKEEKSNLQIRKKSSEKDSKKSTPQRPIPAPRNQRNRRISDDERNFDYSRISTARDSIELTRNFIRARSPSCKRKLFVDSEVELKKNSSKLNFDESQAVATIFQEKLKVAEKGFLVENKNEESIRHFSKNNEGKRIYEVSVRRDIRRKVQNQSSGKSEESRVLSSGTFIKKGKSRGKIENVIVCRNTRSPSPNFIERKQNESVRPSTRRGASSSPSKSPENNFRPTSAESKSSDLKITRRPVVDTPRKEDSFQKEQISNFSKDIVDGPIFKNSHNPLESNEFETLEKKNAAFVIDIDNSTEVKKTPKKPMLRSEKTSASQKLNSPTTPIPRPSSSLSISSAGSGRTKMATKVRSAASRGPTQKSSGSIDNRSNSNDSLLPCKICSRRFATDRISLHEKICAKAGQKKRKQFDAMKFRVQGTELESFVKSGIKKTESKTKKPTVKSNWRKTHEEFINTIRSAKQVQAHLAAGGKLSDLPPPPPSDNSDYIQCPHCGRKFNESAAERHIPKCQNMRHNKPNPRAPPKPYRR